MSSSSTGSAGAGGLRCVISSAQPSVASHRWSDEGRAGTGLGAAEGEAEARSLVNFRVLLRQNKEQLDEVFKEVSDPNSSRYGQYLNKDQLRELVSPPVEEQSKVVRFLLRSLEPVGSEPNASKVLVESQGDYIQVQNASIPAVERTFGCEMHRFRELPPPKSESPLVPAPAAAFTPRVLLRCAGEVSVPAEFAGLVTGVSGLADFPPLIHGGPHPHPVHFPIVHPVPASSKQPQQRQPHTIPVAFDQTAAEHGADGVSAPVAAASAGAAAAPTPVQHPFHPHQTLRTVEQLRHVALDFEREQEEKKTASK